ncbi:MAG: hypothetical protein AAGA45_04750 [Verrucomicrobiota bacterium]
MANPTKLEKEINSRQLGNLLVALFMAVVWAAIGLSLGIGQLASITVNPGRTMPEADKREDRKLYVVKGSERNVTFRNDLEALLNDQPGVITVSVDQLNAWAKGQLKRTNVNEEQDGVEIEPLVPSFNIIDGKLTVFLQLKLAIQDRELKTSYYAEGTFSPSGDLIVFQPEATYLGSARLPPVFLTPLLNDKLLAVYKQIEKYEEVLQAWQRVKDVRIEGDTLRIIKG